MREAGRVGKATRMLTCAPSSTRHSVNLRRKTRASLPPPTDGRAGLPGLNCARNAARRPCPLRLGGRSSLNACLHTAGLQRQRDLARAIAYEADMEYSMERPNDPQENRQWKEKGVPPSTALHRAQFSARCLPASAPHPPLPLLAISPVRVPPPLAPSSCPSSHSLSTPLPVHLSPRPLLPVRLPPRPLHPGQLIPPLPPLAPLPSCPSL